MTVYAEHMPISIFANIALEVLAFLGLAGALQSG